MISIIIFTDNEYYYKTRGSRTTQEVLVPNGGALKWRTALALTPFYLDISFIFLFVTLFALSFNLL